MQQNFRNEKRDLNTQPTDEWRIQNFRVGHLDHVKLIFSTDNFLKAIEYFHPKAE